MSQKFKSKKSAKKRFRITQNEKIFYKRPYKAHILEKKSAKSKRNKRASAPVCKGDAKMVRRVLIQTQ